MKNFIISNWPTLAIVGAFLIYVIYLVVSKKWEQLRALAYKLMLEAEKAIVGTAQGQNRFNAVCIEVYGLLPAWFRFFVPADKLKAKLQAWYVEIADYIDDGKINGSADKDFKDVTEKIESTDQAAATDTAKSYTVAQ